MSRILILDDDPGIRRTLDIQLRGDGHETYKAASAENALEILAKHYVDIALVDLQLPGMDGIEFTRKLRDMHRDVEVVIITAHGSIESAVEAMKEGSFDYITKPFTPQQVRHRLRQIERVRGLKSEVDNLRGKLDESFADGEIVTASPEMRHLLELSRTAAETDATVLITGESGTGKGLFARFIHENSARKRGPLVTVDCTAFQETLLESDLFGHRKGAFTGAVSDKVGKVETGAAGTIFLDEVGEIPQALQAKILRLVEERKYERVGDPAERTLDARIIAATNRDLDFMVKEKSFRADLFYRLSVIELHIPPLRNRTEDLEILLAHFIRKSNLQHRRRVDGMDDETMSNLISYPWPGNVRELAHVIERAVLVCPGRVIRMDHLPPRFLPGETAGAADGFSTLSQLEEEHIRKALALNLSQEETANLLGIDPSTLWRKRKKYSV